jgi:hypothetical protein
MLAACDSLAPRQGRVLLVDAQLGECLGELACRQPSQVASLGPGNPIGIGDERGIHEARGVADVIGVLGPARPRDRLCSPVNTPAAACQPGQRDLPGARSRRATRSVRIVPMPSAGGAIARARC